MFTFSRFRCCCYCLFAVILLIMYRGKQTVSKPTVTATSKSTKCKHSTYIHQILAIKHKQEKICLTLVQYDAHMKKGMKLSLLLAGLNWTEREREKEPHISRLLIRGLESPATLAAWQGWGEGQTFRAGFHTCLLDWPVLHLATAH